MTALTRAVLATDSALKDLVYADKDGEVLLATLWTTRPDNVCLIVPVMATSIWRPKNASVKDNGLEMTALKVNFLAFFSSSFFRY